MTPTMTLMAVKHYDPRYFSQSGRVEQELELYEGDIICPLGTFTTASRYGITRHKCTHPALTPARRTGTGFS